MAELFPTDFVESLASLRLAVRQAARGGRHGEHRSRDQGSGLEFQDFRAYRAGDDIRRVDWNLYRRSGELFVRLFEEREDVPVYILLDGSDSMYFEDPPRSVAARQLAAALTAVCLNQMDRVTLYPLGAALGTPLTRLRGQGGLHQALAWLAGQAGLGPTGLAAALAHFGALRLRPGLAVVISDFFDPAGLAAVEQSLSGLRHKLLIAQVARAGDGEPRLDGEVRLLDCETGQFVELSVTGAVLNGYRQAWQSFCGRLHDFTVNAVGIYLRLDADEPVTGQLHELFVNGVLSI